MVPKFIIGFLRQAQDVDNFLLFTPQLDFSHPLPLGLTSWQDHTDFYPRNPFMACFEG